MSMVTFTKEVAQLIESQFPAIYREEGEELVAFVKAYYEFLQSNDQYSYKLGRQIFDIGDIDSSLNEFIRNFKQTYLADFPFATVTDKRFAIKHITDYYRTKGTEQSLELLMKLLFSEEVSVYYPGQDILRASDSEWYKPYYLEVSVSRRNASFLNKEVTGVKSGAKAFVESIVRKRVNGKIIDVLYLSGIRGNFKTGERITDNGVIARSPKIIGSMTSVDIVLGGRNNAVGDVFNVITDQGVQGKVKVTSVSAATGRVDFSIYKHGWGYTTDGTTDVYVSDALLFVNNANTAYIPFEKVYQPIEKITIISGENILGSSNTIGKYITGRTSGGALAANGIIVGIANTDANGAITTAATSNGVITIQTSSGTFGDQKVITLDSTAGYQVGEYVNEESTVEITFTNKVGSFTNNEKVEQSVYESIGITVTGITSTLTTSNTTITVSSTANLVVGQPLVKTSGTGAFKTGTVIKAILSSTQLVLDRLPLTAGSITFTAQPYDVRINYAFGKVVSSNTDTVTLTNSFGSFDLESNSVISGVSSGASALPTALNITSIGARGQVSTVSGNNITVDVNYGMFNAGNSIRGDKTKRIYTINTVIDGGAYMIYLQDSTSANAILYTANTAYVEGMIIGQNTTAVGISGNTSPFFFANTYTSYLYTRREDLLSPPRYANNAIVELVKTINRIAGGKSADFEIGAIGDVEENVTLYTDIIGDTNVAGVPYSQIKLSGQNSGYGFVSDMTIVTGGSGYANNDRISFAGGGFAGGEPTVSANAYITTDGTGAISMITVDVNGEGYYEPPTFVLPNNGAGADANVAVVMNYGYGFPKNPNAEYFNFIGDVLNTSIADIGSIALLSKMNPGTEYTADPFVLVRNKYTASYQRYDLVVEITNVANGSFRVGEEIVQTVLNTTSVKGRVKRVETIGDITKLYLERISMSIAFADGYSIRGAETGTTADVLTTYADQTSPPIGENGVVNAVAISASGIATGLEVVSSGFGYINNGPVTLESVTGENPFIITATTRTEKQGVSEGFWRSTNSHLNSEKKIHDNKYYQEYSYDVFSGLSLNRYETVLKKVFHVAGTQLFGSVVKASSIDSKIAVSQSSIQRFRDANSYFTTTGGDFLILSTGNNLIVRKGENA